MLITDDGFLLQFLRAKKYSMDDACKVFENNHLFRATHPEWMNASPERLAFVKDLAKEGVAYILRKRASDGSMIFVLNLGRLDVDKYSAADGFNYIYTTIGSYFEIEENQFLGCTLILNYVDCPLKNFTAFTIREMADFAASANKSPGRFKKYYTVGLPAAANALLTAAKSVMTEKQRDRLVFLKDFSELGQHFDKSVLTEILGGTESEKEVIDEFVKNFEANFAKFDESNKTKVDLKKAAACRDIDESIGSFRTLDID
jgi:hypothetical protein